MAQSIDAAGIETSYQGNGLREADIQTQRKQYGYNEVPEKHVGPFMGTLKRMWGPIPWLLEAAMIFELVLGKAVQAAVVFLLLVFSAVLGEIQEKRAKKAIGYLHQQLQINVRVLRNRIWQTTPSRELVPGDIVHARVGDIISAIFTIGWLALGLGLLWYYLRFESLSADQISSLMFLFLICSAMQTILMTRTRNAFWSFAPSKWVGRPGLTDPAAAEPEDRNRIAAILAGAHIKPGDYEEGPGVTHVNLLRTLEAMYKLIPSGDQQQNAAAAGIADTAIITDVFNAE